ncbi:MAG: YIP1 family protein [Oscillospiraceae bacterium]|nr:YIP1 family protein [Oscillospiraceae bacterium]
MKKYFSKEKWRYLLYTMNHPMDGFYWIRHRDYGSVPIAILLVICFSLCFSLNRISANFIVNDIEPTTVDSLEELSGILLLYALLCVANWSITCLMNGEGRMKDIAIAIGYGCAPLIPAFLLATAMSHFITEEEAAFYSMVIGIGIAYGAILVLIGIMQVHNYTLSKTLQTLLLTFVAVLIIIFVALLLADLIGQVVNFIRSLYIEIIFRT